MFFDLDNFGFNHLAHEHEWHKHDKVVHASDAFAAKRDVVNGQAQTVADLKWHKGRLKGARPVESFFDGYFLSKRRALPSNNKQFF